MASSDKMLDIAKEYKSRYYSRPDLWAEEVLGVELWSKQKEILCSVFENPITVVKSCHAVGKTFIASVAVLAFLYIRVPSKILTTAPTFYQVKDLMWGEINKLFKNLSQKGIPGRVLTTRLSVDADWFAEGLSPKDSVNFQGYHQKHTLCVFDESPGVRREIVEGATAIMAGGDSHMLHIGNPLQTSGHFWELFSQGAGYRVQRFSISYKDTPNFTNEPVHPSIKSLLISPEFVLHIRAKYGVDSMIYRSKCLGEFSELGDNQVISYALAMESVNREDVAEDGDVVMGVDVARFGSDRTVYTIRKGNKILDQVVESDKDTMHIAGKCMALCKEYDIKTVAIDVIGIGSGVYDRLVETSSKDVNLIPINSAERASDAKYYNKRTELWFSLRDWMVEGGKIPGDDDLINELVSAEYSYRSDGRLMISDKDEMKKRIGRSPDLADSLAYSIEAGRVGTKASDTFLAFVRSYSVDDLLQEGL